MMRPHDPAFPIKGDSQLTTEYGLTKREWFAGMALTSLANAVYHTAADDQRDHVARKAWSMADAMIRMSEVKNG